ncbi:MAG: hypothetical protein GY799_14285 [Desulfobulbaceae bacterium]|nr:hypothetical protein [Desulfobulbaceae bacterium]
MKQAIERTARFGAVLKGLGYRGIHLGGIHDSFETGDKILDRMDEIEDSWQGYVDEFHQNEPSRFYLYKQPQKANAVLPGNDAIKVRLTDNFHYLFLHAVHDLFFDKDAALAPMYKKISHSLEKSKASWLLKVFLEDPF